MRGYGGRFGDADLASRLRLPERGERRRAPLAEVREVRDGPHRRPRRRVPRLSGLPDRATHGERGARCHGEPGHRSAAPLGSRRRAQQTLLAGQRGEGRRAVRRGRVREREVHPEDPRRRTAGGAGDHPLPASRREQGAVRRDQASRCRAQERVAVQLHQAGGRGGRRRRKYGHHRQPADRVETDGSGDGERERRVHGPGPLMLQEDPKQTHVPAEPQLIAALYVATNQPLVQPIGRPAQSAQAAVVAVREGALFHVMVALTLAESGENVIYTGAPVQQGGVQQALEEALNFAESMGFILDGTGWANLDDAHRAELLERTPAFWPPADVEEGLPERPKSDDPTQAVARLFAAFCALLLVSCSGMSAEQRVQAAEIHQQLGDNLLHQGDPQGALKEYLMSVDFEETPEARLGLGVIYAWSLGRPQDGAKEARLEFERCAMPKDDREKPVASECARFLKELGTP